MVKRQPAALPVQKPDRAGLFRQAERQAAEMEQTENQTKYALITGASRGIGRAAAEAFAEEGYHLILTCRRSIRELESLAKDLQKDYRISCQALAADMGCEADVAEVFSQIHRLDVLVNNAGCAHFGLLSDMTSQEWRRVMATNLDSCFYACRGAIPLMLQRHSGKILNISSVWGAQGASMEVAYSASKGGMNAFTKALAKELAPSNIQVNAVACGAMDTEMNRFLSEDEMASLLDEIPSGRLGRPEEAADLVYYLALENSYLTGQVIGLDGGWI